MGELKASETETMATDVENARGRVNDLFAVFASQFGAIVTADCSGDAMLLGSVRREFVDVIRAHSASVRGILTNIDASSRILTVKDLDVGAQTRAATKAYVVASGGTSAISSSEEEDGSTDGAAAAFIADKIPRDTAHAFASELRWKNEAGKRARHTAELLEVECSRLLIGGGKGRGGSGVGQNGGARQIDVLTICTEVGRETEKIAQLRRGRIGLVVDDIQRTCGGASSFSVEVARRTPAGKSDVDLMVIATWTNTFTAKLEFETITPLQLYESSIDGDGTTEYNMAPMEDATGYNSNNNSGDEEGSEDEDDENKVDDQHRQRSKQAKNSASSASANGGMSVCGTVLMRVTVVGAQEDHDTAGVITSSAFAVFRKLSACANERLGGLKDAAAAIADGMRGVEQASANGAFACADVLMFLNENRRVFEDPSLSLIDKRFLHCDNDQDGLVPFVQHM